MANEVVRNGEALPADFTLRSTRHENAGATEFESQAKYRIRERVEDERAVRRNHGLPVRSLRSLTSHSLITLAHVVRSRD